VFCFLSQLHFVLKTILQSIVVKPSPDAKTPEMCASPMAAAAFGGVNAAAGFGRGLGPGPSSTSNSHISSDHGSESSDGKPVTRSDDFSDARDSPVFGASSPTVVLPDTPAPPVSTYQPTIYSNVPSGFWVWLEVSASRMRALATLPNSVLYSSFVYPTVQVPGCALAVAFASYRVTLQLCRLVCSCLSRKGTKTRPWMN
jgi:hypothetical protein